MLNQLEYCLDWFRTAKPSSTLTSKDLHTQLGVHFEEVGEMVDSLQGLDAITENKLKSLRYHLSDVANHLKTANHTICVGDAVEFLDSLCDQMVTLIGSAHHTDMNIVEAFAEVNRSNYSKFVDGQAIYDENRKIAKGPNYFKPDLSKYI